MAPNLGVQTTVIKRPLRSQIEVKRFSPILWLGTVQAKPNSPMAASLNVMPCF
jgi:hypothetical protein